jgi:hypothetical protein
MGEWMMDDEGIMKGWMGGRVGGMEGKTYSCGSQQAGVSKLGLGHEQTSQDDNELLNVTAHRGGWSRDWFW